MNSLLLRPTPPSSRHPFGLLHEVPLGPSIDEVSLREDQVRLGLWMFLATVTMLFAAFTSAYIVRRSGSDWRHVALPSMLWISTGILAASSLALEAAHRNGQRRRWGLSVITCGVALTLGLVFLASQIVAWRQMTAAGVYLPSSPHCSFFFVLTGAHAVHVAAALVVLAWGTAATWSAAHRARFWSAARTRTTDDGRRTTENYSRVWTARMGICRTFWHYLGAIWLFLFALVSIY